MAKAIGHGASRLVVSGKELRGEGTDLWRLSQGAEIARSETCAKRHPLLPPRGSEGCSEKGIRRSEIVTEKLCMSRLEDLLSI